MVGLVATLRSAFPVLDARVSVPLLSFLASGVVYLAAAFAVAPSTPDGYLGIFVTSLACAEVAIGIKATGDHVAALRAASPR